MAMLHPIVRWLSRRAIRWFYRDAEFSGAGAIPASGATLIIASHGNELPDIVMTFLSTNRDVLFVANIAAADSWLVRWTYRGLGVIPVVRVRDARALKARGEDASVINANAFVRVGEALSAGKVVAIFPEGNVHDFPHLGRLRTGAAQMALQALERGVTPLSLVPIGYQYESPSTPGSGVLGVVGAPVALESWEAHDPRKRTTELTVFMREQLREVTRNARARDDASALSAFAAAAGAALCDARTSPIAAAHEVQLALSKSSATDGVFVANSVAPHHMAHEAAIRELHDALSHLNTLCTAFGARAWSARDCADVLHAAGDTSVHADSPNVFALLALAPVAAMGWVLHALPFLLCRKVALRYAPTPMEIAGRTMMPGLYIIILWYLLVPIVLLSLGAPPLIAAAVFLAQPRLGDVAIVWRDRLRAALLIRRVRHSSHASRESIRNAAGAVRSLWKEHAPRLHSEMPERQKPHTTEVA